MKKIEQEVRETDTLQLLLDLEYNVRFQAFERDTTVPVYDYETNSYAYEAFRVHRYFSELTVVEHDAIFSELARRMGKTDEEIQNFLSDFWDNRW